LTLVLLDTNAYLRLARRIKPLLGRKFGQKDYEVIILKDVETEVHQNPRLKFHFPWFDKPEYATERLATRLRLNSTEKAQLESATSVLHAHVLSDVARFTMRGRSPPSPTDCRCLAFGQIRHAIVVTDDLGIHLLAGDFELRKSVWHGHELLKKMLSAKVVDSDLIRDIYEALENNNDLPQSWLVAKHTSFRKVFGNEK